MSNRIIESVPNISEGRNSKVVERIALAAEVGGNRVIDISSDVDHNRSVITMVGQPHSLVQGILALAKTSLELIDLREHSGAHPRMGAVDVVPFVPVRNATMDDCISLSHETGKLVADELGIPVYLYEQSATSPERQNLARIRRGEFEGFADKIKQPDWKPDFGSPQIHPTAGVVAIGAREFLIAYNINLATSDLGVAKKIARTVRHSSGGLRYVKALGLSLDKEGIVQVSMNLTNFKKTPILQVFDLVRREAERYGVMVNESEIVGMVPRQAVYNLAASAISLRKLPPNLVLDDRVEQAISENR